MLRRVVVSHLAKRRPAAPSILIVRVSSLER